MSKIATFTDEANEATQALTRAVTSSTAQDPRWVALAIVLTVSLRLLVHIATQMGDLRQAKRRAAS